MSEISEQQAREAAKRVQCVELVDMTEDVRSIVMWATCELSRRDAERAARQQPITPEWLESIGARKMAINRWKIATQFNLWLVANESWCVRIDGFQVKFTTRGQLLDLLAALKGGAS